MEMRVAPDGVQTINAETHSANDNAGVVKFTKDDLVSLLDGLTGEVTLEVSGAAGGCEFAGTDTITVISPGGGPEHSQQAEGALVPGGDEELLDGGDEFTIIEPGTDESGYLDDAFSDEGQEEDATNEDDSGAGSDGEQTDDLTPPVAGLPDTDQTGNLDEIDEPEQPEEHQTLDPEDKQADENVTTPNAPEVEEIDEADTGDKKNTEQDEKQKSEPESIEKDDNQQESGDSAGEPEQKQDDPPVKEPLTPIPAQEPPKVLLPVQPILEYEKPSDQSAPKRDTGQEPDNPVNGDPDPIPPVNPPQEIEDNDPPPPVDLPEEVADLQEDEADNDGDEPLDESTPVEGPVEVVEEDPEPVVTCPIDGEVRFDLDEVDVAGTDLVLLVTVRLPADLPEDYDLASGAEVELRVKLGVDRYAARTVEAEPAPGTGVFKVTHDDLIELLGDYRGEVTLEVLGEVNGCEFAGTDHLLVTETLPEVEEATVTADDSGENDEHATPESGNEADEPDEQEISSENQQTGSQEEPAESAEESVPVEDEDEAKEPDLDLEDEGDEPADGP